MQSLLLQVLTRRKPLLLCKTVSDNRGVGPCILAMRMAFQGLTKLPEKFRFIADGYSAYPLAAMEFVKKLGKDFTFKVTQVIGLTNDAAVSTQHRPFKQMIERRGRTYKASYRHTNGFDNIDGANYNLALWVAYYDTYQVSVRRWGNFATPLPPSIPLLIPTCGSLHLVVNTRDWTFTS